MVTSPGRRRCIVAPLSFVKSGAARVRREETQTVYGPGPVPGHSRSTDF